MSWGNSWFVPVLPKPRSWLNAHCVFMPEGYLFTSSNTTSGSGSRRRLLTSDSASTESSKLLSSSKTSASPSSSDDSTLTNVTDSTYTVKINKEEVTGQFVCLQISDCMNLAADPSTCYPSACGSPESQEQCNYQGTCTYKNRTNVTKRSCMCYAGFKGDKCETEVSGACDVDCGTGATASMASANVERVSTVKSTTARKATQLSAAPDARTISLASTTTPATSVGGSVTVLRLQ
ncbi:EGF-like, conserved site [Phytophthora cactorum]|nr:EGF-like, conserved site [Phytophthora cactorum]